jgi:hypothetical protein
MSLVDKGLFASPKTYGFWSEACRDCTVPTISTVRFQESGLSLRFGVKFISSIAATGGEVYVTHQEELLRMAVALRRGSDYFKLGWNINFLQAFIRDGGRCVYCGIDVMNEFCVACGDHLLPNVAGTGSCSVALIRVGQG